MNRRCGVRCLLLDFTRRLRSTFCSAAEAALTAPQPGLTVPLGNPLSEEAGVLRPSLVPGMLTMIAGNLHRDVSDVRLFELGTVFSGTTEKVEERPAVAFGAVGSLPQQGPLHASRNLEFHDVKGVVEQVLGRFQARAIYFDRFPAEAGLMPEWLHPYRAARVAVDGLTVGWFGQLHPREAAARKLKEPVLVGELYLDRLYKLALRKPVAREISRFQPVRRDFSLVLDKSIEWERIDQALAGLQISELVDWRVREVFRDARLGAEEYSLLLGATFQAADRTLREEELQEFQARVVEAVGKAGARLEPDRSPSNVDLAPILGTGKARRRPRGGRTMAQFTFEPEGVDEILSVSQAEREHAEAQAEAAQAAHLALSPDDFSALEQRILRAVDLVKRGRVAHAAAEERAVQAEVRVREQAPLVEHLQKEVNALRAERDEMRKRVEKLLQQLESIEL